MTDSIRNCKTNIPQSERGIITPEILEELKKGEHDAFQKVYLRWRKPIYNFLYQLTSSLTEADDITQDVFARLWDNREKIDASKNIRTFLYLMAKQSAIKYFEKQKARKNYVTYEPFDDVDQFTSHDIVVEKEIELLKELALSRMPKRCRYIYELKYNEGLTNDEIAEKLGITKESVYNQLSLARKELQKLIYLFIILFFPF